jgi:hypothetical protein
LIFFGALSPRITYERDVYHTRKAVKELEASQGEPDSRGH